MKTSTTPAAQALIDGDELSRTLFAIRPVSKFIGRDLIYRDSMIDLVQRRLNDAAPPLLRRTVMARCNCDPMCEKCCNGPCDCTCATQPEPAPVVDTDKATPAVQVTGLKEALAVMDKSASRITPNAQTAAWTTIRAALAEQEAEIARLRADNERLKDAFDDTDETACVHWYMEWFEKKRSLNKARSVLQWYADGNHIGPELGMGYYSVNDHGERAKTFLAQRPPTTPPCAEPNPPTTTHQP